MIFHHATRPRRQRQERRERQAIENPRPESENRRRGELESLRIFSERPRGAAERLAGIWEPPEKDRWRSPEHRRRERNGRGVRERPEERYRQMERCARGAEKDKRSGQEHRRMERSGRGQEKDERRGPEHQRGRKNDWIKGNLFTSVCALPETLKAPGP